MDFDVLADTFTLFLLATLFAITILSQVRFLIVAYRVQSLLVVLIALCTIPHTSGQNPLADVLIALLPALVAWVIKPLLVRATLPDPSPERPRARRRPRLLNWVHADWTTQAEQEWLRRQSVVVRVGRSFFAPALFILALLGAFYLASVVVSFPEAGSPALQIGLTVTITLVLIGLYNMVIKRDLISQVLGLLVMDHGLFLAVLRIVLIQNPAAVIPFVWSLYVYTFLTMFILVLLLPQLRRMTNTIDLSEIEHDSSLKG